MIERVRGAFPWQTAGLAAAAVLLAVRIVPGWWSNSMWLDEGYTRVAMDSFYGTAPNGRWTMAFYFIAMGWWGKVSVADWWVRLPSVAGALGTLVVTARIARRVAGRVVAAIAPVLLAASPMFAAKAIEARAYSLETLCTAAMWLVALKGVDAARTGRSVRLYAVGLVACAILGPGLHMLFIAQFVALAVFLLVSPGRPATFRLLVPAALACVSVTLVFRSIETDQHMGWLSPYGLLASIGDGYLSTRPAVAVVMVVISAFGAAALVRRYRSGHDVVRLIPLLWLVFPVLVLWVVRLREGAYDPRYLAPITPAVALLLATGVSTVVRIVRNRLRIGISPLVGAGAVAALLCMTLVAAPHVTSERLEDWDGVASWVASDARPGDGIFFEYKAGDQRFRVPFEAAWQTTARARDLPSVGEPRPVTGQLRRFDTRYTEVETYQRAGTFDRIWMIGYRGSEQMQYDKNARFQQLFQPARSREFGGDITVRLFERRSSSR